MNELFLNSLNISITASWLVFAIVLIRMIFKKIPKSVYCLFWGFVGLRLIFPFSIETTLSLIPSATTIDMSIHESRPTIQTGIDMIDRNANNYISSYYTSSIVQTNSFESWMNVVSIIWLIGIVCMILYSMVSYYKLYQQVQASISYKDNIYVCDEIDSPFILGVFNPKIYLPSNLNEKQMMYVLQHEQAHLKRKDHFYKPFGFILLSIYWFNPVLWVAYSLLCKDIEAACDERVIHNMNTLSKKEYTETLFNCSIQRNLIMACPLAFGEVGVKERIKSIVNYKKPSFWIIILSIVLCIGISLGFLTNPRNNRIIDIQDPVTYITLLDNVSDIVINESRVEISHEDEVNEFIGKLLDVKISRQAISQSRSEERDKTNQIGIIYNHRFNHMTYINFSKDYSSVWIDDGVKPSLSYQVKNPSLVKDLFTTTPMSKPALQSFHAKIMGFEESYIVVQAFANEKESSIADKFYLETSLIKNEQLIDLSVGNEIEVVYNGNIYKNDVLKVEGIYLINDRKFDSILDGFLSETILNQNASLKPTGLFRVESHYVLLSGRSEDLITKKNLNYEYLAVLYQEFNLVNDELLEIRNIYQPVLISYTVNEEHQYNLVDYKTYHELSEIQEVIPEEVVQEAMDKTYYDQLYAENMRIANEYFDLMQLKSNLIHFIQDYDNGYTDEDYNLAQGEACLHPRVKFTLDSIEVEIWSDPHRLFCYVVKIRDLDKLTFEKIYVDTNDYEELCELLEKYGFVKTYI